MPAGVHTTQIPTKHHFPLTSSTQKLKMKRSFPVNINGRIYNIDEDAYHLLDEYLSQIRMTFSSEDEREIVEDIEARINEHFAETSRPDTIITLEDVTSVIEIMGRPEQIDAESENATRLAPGQTAHTSNPAGTPPPYNGTECRPPKIATQKKFYRRLDDKVFGGVVSGIATYLNWNVVLLRILIVVLALSTAIFPFFITYMILWMVIPAADTPRRRLEMMGEPVTPDAIGRNLTVNADPRLDTPDHKSGISTLGDIFNILMKGIMGFFSFIAGMVGLSTMFAALVLLLLSLGLATTSPEFISTTFDVEFDASLIHNMTPAAATCFGGLICLCISLPALIITWFGACMIFGISNPAKTSIITAVIIEILLILGTIILGLTLSHNGAHIGLATIAPIPLLLH